MFGIGLLKIIIEVALVIYFPGFILLLLFQFLKVKELRAIRRLVKWLSLAALFIVLYMKLNSFYLQEGGIEYRRIPVKYPFEIKETETGTYIDGAAISDKYNCDINAFRIDKDHVYFICSNSADSIFSFNFSTGELKTVSPIPQKHLESFNSQFISYHFLKIDGVLALIFSLIVGIAGYSKIKTSINPLF